MRNPFRREEPEMNFQSIEFKFDRGFETSPTLRYSDVQLHLISQPHSGRENETRTISFKINDSTLNYLHGELERYLAGRAKQIKKFAEMHSTDATNLAKQSEDILATLHDNYRELAKREQEQEERLG